MAGLHSNRLTDPKNTEEKRFARTWAKLKKESAALSWLLGDGSKRHPCSRRDHEVADTVIQWLGTEVGNNFLRSLGYVRTTLGNKRRAQKQVMSRVKGEQKQSLVEQERDINASFAKELCTRLNVLLAYWDKEVARDIRRLLEERVNAGSATQEHPHIQCTTWGQLGILGLLNGVIAEAATPGTVQPKLAIQTRADGTYTFILVDV